jgi:L-fuculose-phosphate aldolase
MTNAFQHPREQIIAILDRIYQNGMTTTSGGNLSILDDQGDIWITPAGIDKGALVEEDVVRVRGGRVVEGRHEPSSELPFHRAIYQTRPDVRAVVHAHPQAMVAFSLVHRLPEISLLPRVGKVCGTIDLAAYAIPGSEDLGRYIAETFGRGNNAVLMVNHGMVTAGASLAQAFERFETMDFAARSLILAESLGKTISLTPQERSIDQASPSVLEEFDTESRTPEELALRRQMIRLLHRIYRQRLLPGTSGTVSCRLEGESFLITPEAMDRASLTEGDLVLMRGKRRERGTNPPPTAAFHGEVYRANPDLHAAIEAPTPSALAFCLTGTSLDSRTIPESAIVLRNIPLVEYGASRSRPGSLARDISEVTPVVFVRNETVITVGSTLTQAFDRLEVAEFSARSVIDGRSLGTLFMIGDQELRDIEIKYKLKRQEDLPRNRSSPRV